MALVRCDERKLPAGKRHCAAACTAEDSPMCVDDLADPSARLDEATIPVPIPIPPPIRWNKLRPFSSRCLPIGPNDLMDDTDEPGFVSVQCCGRPVVGPLSLCSHHMAFWTENFADCQSDLYPFFDAVEAADFYEEFVQYVGVGTCLAGLIDYVPAPVTKDEVKQLIPQALHEWSSILTGHPSTALSDVFAHWSQETGNSLDALLAPPPPPLPKALPKYSSKVLIGACSNEPFIPLVPNPAFPSESLNYYLHALPKRP
jgi:hypothetical protein